MKKQTTRAFFLVVLTVFSFSFSRAQLVMTPATATQLAQSLVGAGLTISNITYTGVASASAIFSNGGTTNMGMTDGIALTSGLASNCIGGGSNTVCFQGTDNGAPGDAQLTALSGYQTHNACVLEFDLTVTFDTLKFNYVFGSEEYPEYVGSLVYNDIFAFFISGPGIVGQQNIALVPLTATPVSINNVNCFGANPGYYLCNNYPALGCFTNCPNGTPCPANQAQTSWEYDGFTRVLTATKVVQPCQTYHLKLAVADCTDGIYDSGVFIQAGSLSAVGVHISPQTFFFDPIDSLNTLVEGCVDGAFDFQLNQPAGDTLIIPIGIGGTATDNVDYTGLNDTLVFLPGDTALWVPISTIVDGITEGNESITVYLLEPCTGVPYDSATIYIADDYNFTASNDTIVCENGTANLNVTYSPYYAYQWIPSNMVACDTCNSTTSTTAVDQQYIVQVSLGSCLETDTINVTVDQLNPNAGADQILCNGDTTLLTSTGGINYSWLPTTGLSNPNSNNTSAWPDTTTNYVLTVTGNNPQCFETDSVLITVVDNIQGYAGVDTIVCKGDPVQLGADSGVIYAWTPSDYLDDPNSQFPVSTPLTSTVYTVVITNIYGCTDTIDVDVQVFPDPPLTTNQAYEIYFGETAQLFAHGGANSTYSWTPSKYLDATDVYNPLCTPDSSIYYYVTIITENGCIYYDTTYVRVLYDAMVMVPNAFTPNGDGINDYFNFISRGPFHLNSFQIFNRWGQMVFSTNDADVGWDGRNQGLDEEMGTYVYYLSGLDGNGLPVERKGNVVLLR